MTTRQVLAAALAVTAAVMLFAPLAVQQGWWTGCLVLTGSGYLIMTVFRWTRPRQGVYRRKHTRW